MAPLRGLQARSRPRRSIPKLMDDYDDPERDELALPLDDEPPLKRIRTSRNAMLKSRWIPGGRGGGGRHVELDELESLPTTPRIDAYPRPRSRPSRNTTKKAAPTPRFSARSSRNRGATRPRYSTAAAATAAAAHGDGYKPREERGWEEFHPDLDLDADFAIIPSEEVDGLVKKPPAGVDADDSQLLNGETPDSPYDSTTPTRRRPGRPPRRTDSMLQSILIPETPKIVPPPGPNPRERLTLPKPSFRQLDPFVTYEQHKYAQQDYVDKSMANVGYQESEAFLRPDRSLIRQSEGSAEEDLDLSPDLIVNGENSAIGGSGVGRVEYDMDEQDVQWLDAFNKTRTKEGTQSIKPAIFEITMTKIEKEWHALEKRIPKPNPKAPQTQRPRSSSAAAVNGEPAGDEGDTKCAICDDGDCENANAIVFCDGCDLAVHQECYGVPYIPEGQWLCRKCQLVGNSRPSCIFCPHEGGAFKQTNNSKWAHLFCAIWIPEVQIGNPSLMEPITDVEKVPVSRWKLSCYICKQSMGASIQCSDGRCYEAFHLTCARQAGLYLRMKTGGGQNTLMDQSTLRAYCHRHSPADWKQDHNTDKAYHRTAKYCEQHFKGQIWADSRASALSINDNTAQEADKGPLKVTLTNKKGQKQKTIWRLPSGAPVIPEVILKSIEESLVRFSVQKKKEYVSEVCRYWTLKREARRGAALLKRLQLQMDTFSSFEVTRRDYKAQGATGRARLDRRIDFAETLEEDLERIKQICELVRQREFEKVQEARLLKNLVDVIYFPIPPLLAPVVDKAIKHDKEAIYRPGLLNLKARVSEGVFTSVTSFSTELVQVFAERLGSDAASFSEIIQQVSGRAEDVMSSEHKEFRKLARNILRATQPFLEDALRKESELTGRPFAQQMKELDQALMSRRNSLADSTIDAAVIESIETIHTNGVDADVEMQNVDTGQGESIMVNGTRPQQNHVQELDKDGQAVNTPPASTNGITAHAPNHINRDQPSVNQPRDAAIEPPTPPVSLEGHRNQPAASSASQGNLGLGGIPWYVEQFDPDGTTIYEERWTGQQVLREMSEELSEMDEKELERMDLDIDLPVEDEDGIDGQVGGAVEETKNVKGGKKKAKRAASGEWGDRAFRQRRMR